MRLTYEWSSFVTVTFPVTAYVAYHLLSAVHFSFSTLTTVKDTNDNIKCGRKKISFVCWRDSVLTFCCAGRRSPSRIQWLQYALGDVHAGQNFPNCTSYLHIYQLRFMPIFLHMSFRVAVRGASTITSVYKLNYVQKGRGFFLLEVAQIDYLWQFSSFLASLLRDLSVGSA